jgi:hypothetical protein
MICPGRGSDLRPNPACVLCAEPQSVKASRPGNAKARAPRALPRCAVLTDDRPPVSSRSVPGLVAVDAPTPRKPGPGDYFYARLLDEISDLAERPSWHAGANCKGLPHLMYPTESSAKAVAQAVSVCDGCPVFDPCAEAGAREFNGVWGGRLRTRYARKRAARQAS